MSSFTRLCFGKNAFLRDRLEKALRGCSTVLDVGCGPESPLRSTVAVDAHLPSLRRARGVRVAARAPRLPFRDGSFDAAVALDVVEHLDRRDGEVLLAELERVARRRVVVFTPNGFLEQGAREGNPFQVHRSGWTPADFARRGYRIVGVNGVKGLRGEGADLRWRPKPLWRALSCVTQGMLFRLPSACFQILCVKDRRSAVSRQPSWVDADGQGVGGRLRADGWGLNAVQNGA
ncbi:MAG: class I SAM-dependent methyltransferase [Planctomycetes bacterium]|nr:class I SAM-dependent methyltransferase [Planctomycetota bacterium]